MHLDFELSHLNSLYCCLKGFLCAKCIGIVGGNEAVYNLGPEIALLASGKEYFKGKEDSTIDATVC